MPQLGETVADGTVTKWFKKVGDSVVRGETLFEVSTDKVDTEIPAPADGIVTSILVDEGTTVDVGTVLCVIGGDGAPDTASAARVATARPQPVSFEAKASASKAPIDKDDRARLSPVVRRLLSEHNLQADEVTGTGPLGRLTRDDILAFVAARGRDVSSSNTAGSQSPVVRRLLREHGLEAAAIIGTGPDGRITRRDVEEAIERQPQAPHGAGDETIPFTKIRRLTAEHMVRSKATSAHTLMVKEVDYEQVEAVRRAHGAAFKEQEGFTLTYLPFNAMAVLEALRQFPHLNASVGDDELIVHHDLNLGIAVDLDGDGLVVPVVHRGDGYDLRGIARKIRELAVGARSKRLTVDDVAGGTFTITNPGPFDTLLTGAIINQPQVAILSTDGVSRKPVIVTGPDGAESIGVHSVGILALTFDHRAVDGAYAARFLARVDEILNTRDWASEL
jgi:2-oxoglutarate dehydrogenase E2 component (dihydrolipoamide succinyltransferase)